MAILARNLVGASRELDLHQARLLRDSPAYAALVRPTPVPLDAVQRDRLTGLVVRGQALLAMGRRQGAAASVASSLGKLGTTEMMFDNAVLRAELAGADAMLWGPEARGRGAVRR